MKTQHFLRHGLLIILFSATTFIVQAQTPLDAFVTTTVPVNDSVVGTMFITLADTNQVDLVEIKLGSKDGVTDLYNWNFNSSTVYMTLGNPDPNGRRNNLMEKLDLRSASGAQAALDKAGEYLDRISLEVASLGAQESRLNTSLSILATTRDNYIAAAGRISDADIAQETADLIRSQILQQTAAAIFAQANRQPEIVLALLS